MFAAPVRGLLGSSCHISWQCGSSGEFCYEFKCRKKFCYSSYQCATVSNFLERGGKSFPSRTVDYEILLLQGESCRYGYADGNMAYACFPDSNAQPTIGTNILSQF